jgi:predicted MFS family arabinose efflux permease
MSQPQQLVATVAIEEPPQTRISSDQWRSGIAAWLGWTCDGLDMQLYLMVAQPFVALLLTGSAIVSNPAVIREVNYKSAIIQAAFLAGWALGGALFGRVGDLLGRARTLSLTIFVYACFTGLSFVAQTWWQLMIFRFIAALGIGGEWAVGSSLLAETWPSRMRPWLAAVLQSGVNIGVIVACGVVFALAPYSPRWVFVVGIVPALLVFWIRRFVPEPEEWQRARKEDKRDPPNVRLLFVGHIRRTTVLAIIVCAFSLTPWWAFMFWAMPQVRNLPELASWTAAQQQRLATFTLLLLMIFAIGGNFFGGLLAKLWGFRFAILGMLAGFFAAMIGTFIVPRHHVSLLCWVAIVGFFSGVFGLFTMYLPPLFPTLLRTTGAGFSYNIGRLAAAAGVIIFGLPAPGNDFRLMLFYNSFLLIPAMLGALLLPEHKSEGPLG